jgi:hypothetical protein
MKRFPILIFCAAVLLVGVARPSLALNDREAQGRFGVDIAMALDEKVTLILDEEFRRGDDQSEYYLHSEIGVKYAVLDWLDVDVFYRFIGDKEGGSWALEFRPRADAILEYFWKHFGISDRNRFEYRIRADYNSYGRYRNKLKFLFPFEAWGYPFHPYVADEIFVDLNGGRFERNRIYGGLDFMFSKHVGMDIYYFWQYEKLYPGTQKTHVGGLKVKLKF